MAILIKIDAFRGQGDSQLEGYADGNWFHVDNFAVGIDRELKESGQKGGTADINIGVGELQECTVSKSMNSVTPLLAQFAINGNSAGTADIDFVQTVGEGGAVAYLRYKLDRCWIKSWSTSGDADDRPTEEVAFYYNKIAFAIAGKSSIFSWDRVRNVPWTDSGIIQPPGSNR